MLSAKEALEQKLKYEQEIQLYEKAIKCILNENRRIYLSSLSLDFVISRIEENIKQGFTEFCGLLKEDVIEDLKKLGYKVFYQCFIYRDVRPNVVNGRCEYEFLKNYKWYTKVFWDDSLIEQKVKCCNYWEQL